MIGPGSVDGVEVEQWEEKLLTCLCGGSWWLHCSSPAGP